MFDMAHALLSFIGDATSPYSLLYSKMVINNRSVTDLHAVVQIHQFGVCALEFFALFSLNNIATRFDQSRPSATPAAYLHCFLPYPPPSLASSGPGKISHLLHCTPAYNTAGPATDIDSSQCPPSKRCLPLVSCASWLTLRISYYMPRIVESPNFSSILALTHHRRHSRRFSESYLNPVNAPGHATFPSCMLRLSRYS